MLEEIVNEFAFDKSKKKTIVTDEGSAFVRLFASIIDVYNLDLSDEDIEVDFWADLLEFQPDVYQETEKSSMDLVDTEIEDILTSAIAI